MFHIAIAFLAGILCLNLFSDLPGNSILLLFIGLVPAWWFRRKHPDRILYGLLLIFVAGFVWAQHQASDYLDHVLSEQLAGKDIVITGKIVDIPVISESVRRFVVDVEHITAPDLDNPDLETFPQRIKLSWYYGRTPVHAGETWKLTVRLKPPHGFMNPGGFDYEAWLYQHGIHATGYVRNKEHNRLLQQAPFYSIASLRETITQRIADTLPESQFRGFVSALAVGDRSGIDASHWDALISTGTNHLMAISGLHIGLAAAFGYWLCRRLIPSRWMLALPAQHSAILCGAVIALVYAGLAGFAIPTQRALLMLLCVTGAWLLRRTTRPLDVLSFALFIVLLWDPRSVLSAGFWFSFAAVAVIFYAMTGRLSQSRWLKWGWLQLVIALALFPLSLFMFQQVSLVSPLANLILVPYVSFLVVPAVLAGMLFMPVSTTVSEFLFSFANAMFEFIWPLLHWFSELPHAYWVQPGPGLWLTLLALVGVGIVLAPVKLFQRSAGLVFMAPVVFWQPDVPDHGAYAIDVLDAGQGLAVVVRTHSHTLVYDTGARFSDRLDIGEAVLIPFLRHRGIEHIDLLMISHGDSDHIGGAEAVLATYPETPVSGQGIDSLDATKSLCHAGQQWQWDGVDFSVLHPDRLYKHSNNQSCVLKITGPGGSVLLTGDIEKKIEHSLLASAADEIDADIIVVPHHGSKSSSTKDFVAAVDPDIAIFPAGYRNRYRFPNAAVWQRYYLGGAALYVTGHLGAISIRVHPESGISEAQSYREQQRKYWNHKAPKFRQNG